MLESPPVACEAFVFMLTLIVPGLLAQGTAAFATTPALAEFARYAAPPLPASDLWQGVAAALTLPAETPVAPLAALGAGVDVRDEYVLHATPVTLIAGHVDVRLERRVVDLDDHEAAALIALLNRHFEADGLDFIAPRPASWFVRCSRTPALATSSLDTVVGRAILPFLPTGADGRIWRRWQNEIQMLLFEHAVNQARDARGRAPVSGVWFWGGGKLADVPRVEACSFADESEAGDVARGFARHTGQRADALPASFSATLADMQVNRHTLAALAPIADETALARFATAWLQPAIGALATGRIDALQLVADGHGAALWRAERRSRWARIMSTWRKGAFVAPERIEG